LATTIFYQNVLAQCSSLLAGSDDADLDVVEAEEAGNTTMMTNQTTSGNMTGAINSTS
jgi:hypothetical protein